MWHFYSRWNQGLPGGESLQKHSSTDEEISGYLHKRKVGRTSQLRLELPRYYPAINKIIPRPLFYAAITSLFQ